MWNPKGRLKISQWIPIHSYSILATKMAWWRFWKMNLGISTRRSTLTQRAWPRRQTEASKVKRNWINEDGDGIRRRWRRQSTEMTAEIEQRWWSINDGNSIESFLKFIFLVDWIVWVNKYILCIMVFWGFYQIWASLPQLWKVRHSSKSKLKNE